MSEKPLDYAIPPRRNVRGWQLLTIVAMVGLGMLLLGMARHVIRSQSPVPKPTTAPTYGTRGW